MHVLLVANVTLIRMLPLLVVRPEVLPQLLHFLLCINTTAAGSAYGHNMTLFVHLLVRLLCLNRMGIHTSRSQTMHACACRLSYTALQ